MNATGEAAMVLMEGSCNPEREEQGGLRVH